MLPEDYARVRGLYDQVIDLPTDTRLARLRELSADSETISEVMALITAAEAETFAHLSKPLKGMLNSVNAPKLKPGDTLGVWRIEREIGQGGMGSVFLVERQDGHFTQTAALKFVKGLPRADTLNYFTRERQLLATLTHPNIARLLDGGASAEGQPYLVMEYINGVAIDEYCKQHKLTTPQILKLFTAACDAVAFAHRQLIVHCDLKPSNLLVNLEGRPVLLDFGIARLVDRVDTAGAQGDEPTATAYTPRYASPEQREQGIVSTVSDIYSLGVLLGELLDTNAKQNVELNAILRKATASSHEKRYATVDAFTDDIARFVQKLPVYAMPHMPTYVAKKFMQRRWPLVLAGVAFAATVIGFTVKVLVESQRATNAEKTAVKERDLAQVAGNQAVKERDAAARERDRAAAAEKIAETERSSARSAESLAIKERDRAKIAERHAVEERNRATAAEGAASQTRDFLVSVFKSSSPNAQTGDVLASTLVAEAETRVEQEMRGQPNLQADLYLALADVQKNMGSLKQSRATYVKAVAVARTQNRPLVLAQMLRRLALLDMSSFGGKEALMLGREALALSEKYAKPDSEDVAHSLSIVGYATFNPKEAESVHMRALAIRQKLDPASSGTESTLIMLGHNARDLRKPHAAISYYTRALAINEQKLGSDHPMSMSIRDGAAKAQLALGLVAEAESNIRRNIAISEKLHGTVNVTTARHVASLASLLSTAGRPQEALIQDRVALDVFEKLLGRQTPNYVLTHNHIAQVLFELGRESESVVMVRESLLLAQKVWPSTHPAMAIIQRNAGRILRDVGENGEALSVLQATLLIHKQVHGSNHPEVVLSSIDLGICHALAGRVNEANSMLDVAAAQLTADDKLTESEYQRGRGLIARAQGNVDEAIRVFQTREQLLTARYGENDPRVWLAKLTRSELLATRNQADDKLQSRLLATAIIENLRNVLDPNAPVLETARRLKELMGSATK
jgi:eukaryotic-like serine/threonine-protein kinase